MPMYNNVTLMRRIAAAKEAREREERKLARAEAKKVAEKEVKKRRRAWRVKVKDLQPRPLTKRRVSSDDIEWFKLLVVEHGEREAMIEFARGFAERYVSYEEGASPDSIYDEWMTTALDGLLKVGVEPDKAREIARHVGQIHAQP